MLFGPLADSNVVGFSFAINILPIIIFFSALMSVMTSDECPFFWMVASGLCKFDRQGYIFEGG